MPRPSGVGTESVFASRDLDEGCGGGGEGIAGVIDIRWTTI